MCKKDLNAVAEEKGEVGLEFWLYSIGTYSEDYTIELTRYIILDSEEWEQREEEDTLVTEDCTYLCEGDLAYPLTCEEDDILELGWLDYYATEEEAREAAQLEIVDLYETEWQAIQDIRNER